MRRHDAALVRSKLSNKELLAALYQGMHECEQVGNSVESDAAMMLLSHQLGFNLNAPLVDHNLDALERACKTNVVVRPRIH